ncbi:L-aspartate oxidase [Salinibacillus xinjiangensis]|uniref:L-aspartate oxidase n=1 Tax=Salinibacillus xinjiangensis TaxID=1229268 RepID=A0A6G1X4K1_9BACI|nr:L-aspartate oxidase [Salinibacillus xinjiangensis]MRG85758.1 L-aspartate oxidase [Salinibacillus xinjiangensis]
MPDVIIIGSGIVALTVANRLSKHRNVIIFTKSHTKASNSYYAQGGVAAAVAHNDHWQLHYEDTLRAGSYFNHAKNVKLLTSEAKAYISHLLNSGMNFDRDDADKLCLAMEGGHTKRRIWHAGGDATGKELISFMLEQVRGKVHMVENEMAIDLIMQEGRCLGVKTKNQAGELQHYYASVTILATGGCGQLYAYTSNDQTVTGDGLAMAYRVGAVLTDMEFVQFHPTLLYKNKRTLGLVSEAVRGEGAFLQNEKGERFMKDVHELKDMAPRDVVARAIFAQIQQGERVFLNISQVPNFQKRFPNIHKLCNKHHIQLDKQLIPVIPGFHFMMGGIKTDALGQTSLNGLYAVGEVACTGVHGANRIASNSLLEGIVFGNKVAESILSKQEALQPIYENVTHHQVHKAVNLPIKKELHHMMSEKVGVVRHQQELTAMREWLEQYDFLHADLYGLTNEEIEMINMLTVAWLITTSALVREESIGSHYRSDFPNVKTHSIREEIRRDISETKLHLV